VEAVFLGGARGAPTSLIARALADQEGWVEVPPEWGFHVEPGGLIDVVEGRASLAGFAERLRGEWWERGERPLASVHSDEGRDEALERFRRDYPAAPLDAAAALFRALVAPERDAVIVDRHPGALPHAQGLRRLFGGARFVHVLADGRSVAAAAPLGSRWAALRGWAADLRRIEAGLRDADDGASFSLPPESFLAIFVDPAEPGPALERIAAFLNLPEPPPAEPEPRPPRGGALVDVRYRALLGALRRESNHAAPLLAAAWRRA
jgi:hypothetical protein